MMVKRATITLFSFHLFNVANFIFESIKRRIMITLIKTLFCFFASIRSLLVDIWILFIKLVNANRRQINLTRILFNKVWGGIIGTWICVENETISLKILFYLFQFFSKTWILWNMDTIARNYHTFIMHAVLYCLLSKLNFRAPKNSAEPTFKTRIRYYSKWLAQIKGK